MERIQITARFDLQEGRFQELEDLANRCIERVRNEDPGTLRYDWFLNKSRAECVVREEYENSEALLAHIENVEDLLVQLTELGTLSVELFGNPSRELRNALDDGNLTVYEYLRGLS